jgi:hypothetical protein
MKSRRTAFVFLALCLFLVAACNRPADFTGFWKVNCSDAFGVQIKKQPGNTFSVSFCGPGGCFAPGEWKPNTPIIGDPKYRVINANTIELPFGQGWNRYTRRTTDTNPMLDYATMPAPNSGTGSGPVAVEANRGNLSAQTEKDPHRPPCTGASCRKIRAFLKKHYCGESPFGNGPDDGCDLSSRKKSGPGVNVKADFECGWNESKAAAECKQHGEPSSAVRSILITLLRQLGLPDKANGETHFMIWESSSADWSLAAAYYSHSVGPDIELCDVIAIIDKNSHTLVLRKLPFQKTNADVPNVTTWFPIGLADVDGGGQVEVILEGNAYEDHWLEVVSLRNGSPKTIFSGLGYYL